MPRSMRSEHWSKLLLLYMTLRHVAPLRKQAQKIEASSLTLPPQPPYQRTSSAIMIKIQATETSGTLLLNRRRMNMNINMCNQHPNFGKETTCYFNDDDYEIKSGDSTIAMKYGYRKEAGDLARGLVYIMRQNFFLGCS